MPPHDPPLSDTLADRNIDTPSGRPLFCPRPELWMIVQRRDRGRLDRLPVKFVIDTGSDVTMIPERFARRQHLVGYDPAAVLVSTDTTFHGTLRERWGTVSTSVGSRSLQLPCFYFSEVIDSPGWLSRLLGWLLRREAPPDGPFVLGRAGVFPLVSLLVERGRVMLSDQPFR